VICFEDVVVDVDKYKQRLLALECGPPAALEP